MEIPRYSFKRQQEEEEEEGEQKEREEGVEFLEDGGAGGDSNPQFGLDEVMQGLINQVGHLAGVVEPLLSTILALQHTVNKQTEQIAKLTTLLERTLFAGKPEAPTLSVSTPKAVSSSVTSSMFPITTLEELKEANNKLTDPAFFNESIKSLECYIPREHTGKGQTLCYNLMKKIMDRNVLTQMTWTGESHSKDKTEKRQALKEMKSFVNFFHTLIKLGDKNFSEQDLKKFFQTEKKYHGKDEM